MNEHSKECECVDALFVHLNAPISTSLNARHSMPLSHKCITRIMGMWKYEEKHYPAIALFCLWQPPRHASHAVLSPSLFLRCLDHSIILYFLIPPMLPCCVHTLYLSLHDLCVLFLLSNSYTLIPLYAFLFITHSRLIFPSSNCTSVHYIAPHPLPLFISVIFFLEASFASIFFSSFLVHSLSFSHCPRNSPIEGGFY